MLAGVLGLFGDPESKAGGGACKAAISCDGIGSASAFEIGGSVVHEQTVVALDKISEVNDCSSELIGIPTPGSSDWEVEINESMMLLILIISKSMSNM